MSLFIISQSPVMIRKTIHSTKTEIAIIFTISDILQRFFPCETGLFIAREVAIMPQMPSAREIGLQKQQPKAPKTVLIIEKVSSRCFIQKPSAVSAEFIVGSKLIAAV